MLFLNNHFPLQYFLRKLSRTTGAHHTTLFDLMSQLAIQETLQSADERCRQSGARLTEKRKRALTLLLDAPAPISAYELKDAYEERYGEPLTAMSAYRMLNFLVEETLAHKLNSVNKYAACAHISCSHPHQVPQFLICDACEAVAEVALDAETLDKIRVGVAGTGFYFE